MKSDGTHEMTVVEDTRKDGVKVHSMSCNESGCTRSSGPFAGQDGKRTVADAVKSHATATRTEAEIRRRNERMGKR